MINFASRRRVYEALPTRLQEPLKWIPFSVLAGRAYRKTTKRQRSLERAPREVIQRIQEERLGQVLTRAVMTVPAYYHLRSLTQRLRPYEALKAFPLVTKHEIHKDPEKFLPADLSRIRHVSATTGGTTGEQWTFLLDDESHAVETAFIHRLWARVGYRPKCRKATFRGVPFTRTKPGQLWQSNPIYNELQFSPFHISQKNIPLYVKALFSYRPHFLHGYPSAVHLLARYAQESGARLQDLGVLGVLLGSEGLEEGQRYFIEEAFKCPVYSWYGHSERVVLGGECECSHAFHHFPDYGVLEIVTNDDGVPAEPEQTGEIVGTGLNNRSQPLIRYRTGDMARALDYRCACGRNFDRFDSVVGRWAQEYVIGNSGARISIAALNIHTHAFRKVAAYQYHQQRRGVLEIRVVASMKLDQNDRAEIASVYRCRVHDELLVDVIQVPALERTARGKMPRLIQRTCGAEAETP
jgi:phenylacetate-CoA ligase